MQEATALAHELSEMDLPDVVAGRYVVKRKLGAGGMGVVYVAEDRAGRGVVALKQLLSKQLGSKRGQAEAFFEREYHTLARLRHPSIIEVYDFGVTQDGPYYTMELLSGADLRELSPLPYVDACRHLCDVASSIALLHTHRLVHRDLSPRNVRLTESGRAKLLDFGALASFGRPEAVIGTPPFIAPEVLRQMPIDQRADLFALGALAYWVLTGKNAFPARRLWDLTTHWMHPPAPPSSVVQGVPHALDDLVMSLLSIDPLGRPFSAAEVIEKLSAIAGLKTVDLGQTVESYLLSARLVGRRTELAWMDKRLKRLAEGRGTEAVIRGGAGVGKTRLLDELALQAQLKGVRVLKADARAVSGGFATVNMLAEAALASFPELAAPSAGPYAALLGHLSERVCEALQVRELAPLAEDPSERRARMQTALHGWFSGMARRQRLMLAVDNIDQADEGSTALLAALGREARALGLIVLVTEGNRDAEDEDGPLRALRQRSAVLKLSELSARACEELCVSLFGDVANVGRVAKLLYDKSGGNPQVCMELANLLVRKQIAKYAAGLWVLAQHIEPGELPSQMHQIVGSRLESLSAAARGLAEALSVYGKPVSLTHAVAMSDGGDERAVFTALDELLAEQVLVSDGTCFGLAQEGFREALVKQIQPERRRTLHLRVAELLLGLPNAAVSVRVEAAGHLLSAGEESRGAELLAQTGRDFVRNAAGEGSLDQVVRALHTALQVYEKQGRSDYEIAEILFSLVPLSFYTDWRLNLQYAERAITLGLSVTGLGLAQRLRRFLPGKLALIVALVTAAVRLKAGAGDKVSYDLKTAIGLFCGLIPPAVATRNICYDVPGVQKLIDLVEPLSLFGEGHIASLMRDFAIGQLRMGQSRELEALEALALMEQRFNHPKIAQEMGETRWKSLYGGILFSQGILYPYWFGQQALQNAERMDALGLRIWRMAADQVRLLHHALRGESEQVQHYLERVELFAVQGSTTWQAEMFWPVLLLSGAVLNGDTIGVRRLWEQLSRRAKDAPALERYAEAARGAYLGLRGQHREAAAIFEAVLPEIEPRMRVAWLTLRALYAAILNESGQHARAREVLTHALSHVREGEGVVVGRHLEALRQLALAEAGLGDVSGAAQRLDALLAEHAGQDQPLLIGLLHKARAEVALLAQDRAQFEQHLAGMERRFRATRNPALIAQWESLAEKGFRSGLLERPARGHAARELRVEEAFSSALSHFRSAQDMHRYVVDLVAARAHAKEVHFYEWRDDGLQRTQGGASAPAPRAVELRLQREARRALEEAQEDGITVTVDGAGMSLPAASELGSWPEVSDLDGAYHTFLLSLWEGDELLIVGGLIVRMDARHVTDIDPSWLSALARAVRMRTA